MINMGNIKYQSDWTFDVFLYKNYGFSSTMIQENQALARFIRLKNYEQIQNSSHTNN